LLVFKNQTAITNPPLSPFSHGDEEHGLVFGGATASDPETRGFATAGILRQFNPPPGITEHSGGGLCMFLPGMQFSEKSKPTFLKNRLEHYN
jgi:hypothetical protein